MIAVAADAPVDPLAMLFDPTIGVAVRVPVLAGLAIAVTIVVVPTDVHMHPRNPDADIVGMGLRQ
jgi:hypothetical protein